jgi:hypothetical protein
MGYNPGEDVDADDTVLAAFVLLRKAAKHARKTAQLHGTANKPISVNFADAMERLWKIQEILFKCIDATRRADKIVRKSQP